MRRTQISAFLVAAVAIITTPTMAQSPTTSRLEAAQQRSKSRQNPDGEARRRRQDAQIRRDRMPPGADANDLLLIRPGEYIVAPDKYRPDNWSPLIHPQYDYSIYNRTRGARLFQDRRRFGSFGPSRFGRGYYGGYGYYDPYGYSPFNGYGDAYLQGRTDADREYLGYIAAQRAGQLLDQNKTQLDDGMNLFHQGQYERAAVAWLGAAKADESDAASRIHAGHALFAVGKYSESVKLLARGFELAPHLATSTYDIRSDYSVAGDFERQMENLKTYVVNHPNDVAGLTMLGYVRYYSDGPGSALKPLNRAAELSPKDPFIQKLVTVARQVGSPASESKDVAPMKAPQSIQKQPVKIQNGKRIAI